MPTNSTVEQVKEYLDIKFNALENKLEAKIDSNREVVTMQYENIQKDVTEIKHHVKETNGKVARNTHDVIILQEKQKQDDKTRKWISGGLTAVGLTVIGWILSEILHIGGR